MGNRYLIDWEEYARLARKTGAEGAVLLKNEKQALPLRKGDRISVFGRIQFDYYKSGSGSGGMVNTKYTVGILDALKEEKELILNEALEQVYRAWRKEHPFDYGTGWAQDPWSQQEMVLPVGLAAQAAGESDAALVVIGRTAGEDRDAKNERGSYLLTDAEMQMMQEVRGAFARMIVVLNVGNIIDMKWVEEIGPDAVLYVWQGGMEGGHAVVDVLTGRVTPCGKLSDTIARNISDYPSTAYFGGENGNVYAEDIYVGYRYFETFAKEKVLYPFGFGLSYTSFAVRCLSFARKESGVCFRVQAENTGLCAGKEVVQIYMKAPQGALGKPARELIAFAKTRLLQPGETQELELAAEDYLLASYDDSGATGHPYCYVMEAGRYVFYVGTDVRSAAEAGSFVLEEDRVLYSCTQALAPTEPFKRMKPQETKDGSIRLTWEDVPLRTYSIRERIAQDLVPELSYTGDRGFRLADVSDGRVSLEEFTAQLSDQDLCCMVRGEGMCSPKVTPGTAAAFGGVTDALQSFGIPCGCCADGPSGIRMDCGTKAFCMPNGTCLACTFDTEAVRTLYEKMGAELRKNRVDTLLGPGMNIHRNPLNGRNFEYFSEDPLLTGKIAVSQLLGMSAYGVTGTIKHFAANNQEYRRSFYNSVVSERALREIYLKGFELAVKEGGAYCMMSTYGAVNGLWTASNYDLLTVILRGEWGYDGLVMTDWWAKMNEEGEEACLENAAAMVRCQNDVYMVTHSSQDNTGNDNLQKSLEDGTLSRGALGRSAMNILKVLMRSPVMERVTGRISQEELDAEAQMSEDEKVDFDMEYIPLEEITRLDVSGLDTSKGKEKVYGLLAKERALYMLRMRVKVDGSALAQVPISVFCNGNLAGTISLNGTDGKIVEAKQPLEIVMPNNYLKFYFAQSGAQIESLELLYDRALDWLR